MPQESMHPSISFEFSERYACMSSAYLHNKMLLVGLTCTVSQH